MKIDFHTHGKLAKALPFSAEYTERNFMEARRAGLDAVCLTEHFNTLGFEEIYEYMVEKLPRCGDCFLWDQLKIYPGMEIDIAESGHVIAVGSVEDILSLNRVLDPHKEKGSFLSFESLLSLASEYDLLLGAAHSFRKGSTISKLPGHLLRQLDFIELNGKDLIEEGWEMKDMVNDLAEYLGLPVAAGSDTHQALQFGCIFNQIPDSTTIEELRNDLERNANSISISEQADLKVKTACVLKRALKEIHALGGDYVSVLLREK